MSHPLTRLLDLVDRTVMSLCGLLFALMIADVFWQVVARNVFGIPALWTLELAQLLVSWCVFLGAGVAVRRGAHYVVELVPPERPRLHAALNLLSLAVITVVALVLVVNGPEFVDLGRGIEARTMPLSFAWYNLPLPLGGALMLLFAAELAVRHLRALARVLGDDSEPGQPAR